MRVMALESALAREPDRHVVRVGDVDIACRVWEAGPAADPRRCYVLLHGNGARSEWWDAVAPLLTSSGRVVAFDLSGHGESGWREEYTLPAWVDETVAATRELCPDRRPILVGHSLGGLVSLKSAWAHPELFTGIILLDCPLRRFTPEQMRKRAAIADRPLRRYATHAEAVTSFKTVPETPGAPEAVLEHVAHRSYRQEGDEWLLHFDPALYRRTTDVDDFLRPYPADTYCIRAEHGFIDEAMRRQISALLAAPERMITVPGVGHNLILEEPVACGWLIGALAAGLSVPSGSCRSSSAAESPP